MNITGIDIETTGLDQAKGHRIIEFCAATFNEQGVLQTLMTRRINPERPIDPAAQAVHGIAFEDLAHSPTIEQVADDIVKVLQASDVLVGHNIEAFDWPFVAGELMRIGKPVPHVPLLDTMKQARWATPLGKYPNLGELCFACDVAYDRDKAHAADYDVFRMMDCFFTVLSQGWFKLPAQAALLKEAA